MLFLDLGFVGFRLALPISVNLRDKSVVGSVFSPVGTLCL